MASEAPNPLGIWLHDRRTRLDPAAFGSAGGRRRTPDLRREEVASRASIGPPWSDWLEQGRGGAPSADVLKVAFSPFAVEGRPEPGMIVYNPASAADAERLRALVAAKDA